MTDECRCAKPNPSYMSAVSQLNLLVLLLSQVSYVKAVDIYFIVSFAFIFAATIEYVLVLLNTGLKRHLSSSNEDTEHSETVNISTVHFD